MTEAESSPPDGDWRRALMALVAAILRKPATPDGTRWDRRSTIAIHDGGHPFGVCTPAHRRCNGRKELARRQTERRRPGPDDLNAGRRYL